MRAGPIPAGMIGPMADDGARCPCGSGAGYEACCGPIVAGERPAPTAEALMRSRFTAFARGDEAHLLRSWHPSTRPARVTFVPRRRWVRLEILGVEGGQLLDQEGEVEFQAFYDRRSRPGVLHELSRFVRDDEGRWVYLGPVQAELG